MWRAFLTTLLDSDTRQLTRALQTHEEKGRMQWKKRNVAQKGLNNKFLSLK